MSECAIVGLIAGLAVLQSIFGVGVLIFGTPCLLLAGIGFEQVLGILLPASFTISCLQLLLDRGVSIKDFKAFSVLLVPTTIAGLAVTLLLAIPRIEVVVSVVLVATAFFRTSERRRVYLVRLAGRHGKAMLASIGLLHGMTNMGGSLLEAYVSSLHSQKVPLRQNIALGYALLATVQLVALALSDRLHLTLLNLSTACVAGLVFLVVGRRCFRTVPEQQYRSLVSVVMVCAAAALIAKQFAPSA
jgi:uncharacterized protein